MSSFGEELRRERELREISLREVAEATKINIRYLQAMESNDFAHLPGGVFNRGFVRAYCQFIGVDSEAMVNAYLLEEKAQTVPGGNADGKLLRGPAGGAASRSAAGRPSPLPSGRGPIPRWFVVILLIAGGIVAAVYIYITFARGGSDGVGPAPEHGAARFARPHGGGRAAAVGPGPAVFRRGDRLG